MLLIVNQKMHEQGMIDKCTKEKIDLEIQNRKNNLINIQNAGIINTNPTPYKYREAKI